MLSALIALLLLLGLLQYYWVDQISEGERARMHTSMRTSATRFSEDFDRELARIYLSLQMDASTMRDQNWKDYAERYQRWFALSPYPRLVDQVYLVQVYANGQLYLAQYDAEVGRFRTINWPPALDSLHTRFTQAAKTTHTEGSMVVSSAPAPVFESLPALVIPLSRMSLLTDRQQFAIEADFFLGDTVFTWPHRPCAYCTPQISSGPLFGYTIVTLNRDYLQHEFIPALARHYFTSDNVLNYNLTIVNHNNPQQVFYQSDPHQQLESTLKNADVTTGLLNVRLDEFDRLLLDNTFIRSTDTQADERRPWRIAISTVASDTLTTSADPTLAGTSDGPWQLILTHRAGSLDAAIANLRMRNLLISFGTLLLLAASVAMIMLATRRAQNLTQQKLDFVAAISHELRTPLAVIRSAGENLADGVVLDPQRARQYGALINNEGRRLTEMVEQALEFAGARSTLQASEHSMIDIPDLIGRVLADFRPQLGEQGFDIIQRIDPDLPVPRGDPQALRRALQNLLHNAIKYSGASRQIHICAELRSHRLKQEIAISIQDHGLGIAPADIPHIFEPFYRSRAAVEANIHGSGLGLKLVQQIVDAHHGHTTVESTLGEGTTFTITLPIDGGPNPTRPIEKLLSKRL